MSDINVCYKCRISGHFARECMQSASGEGGRGNEERRERRFNENNNYSSRNRNGGGGVGGAGGPGGREGGFTVKCYRCNKNGHFARDCKEVAERCYRCNQSGHLAKDCENEIESGKFLAIVNSLFTRL